MENNEQNQAPATPAAPGAKKSGGKKIAIVVVLLVLLAAAGVFIYGRYFNKTKGVLSDVVPQALNSDCKHNDPDLCKFLNNWVNAGDMTMTSTALQDGKNFEYVMKMDGEDRTELISRSDGKEDYHTISIAETTYTLDFADNKWWKYISSPSDGEESEAVEESEELLDFNVAEDKSTYKKIGKEGCAKLTCFKYQVIDPENTESTEYIYFDDKEYLLRKTRSEGKDGSVSESTIEYGDVKVSEPSPVKEGSPYSSSALPVSSGLSSSDTSAMSEEEYKQALEEAADELNASSEPYDEYEE